MAKNLNLQVCTEGRAEPAGRLGEGGRFGEADAAQAACIIIIIYIYIYIFIYNYIYVCT